MVNRVRGWFLWLLASPASVITIPRYSGERHDTNMANVTLSIGILLLPAKRKLCRN